MQEKTTHLANVVRPARWPVGKLWLWDFVLSSWTSTVAHQEMNSEVQAPVAVTGFGRDLHLIMQAAGRNQHFAVNLGSQRLALLWSSLADPSNRHLDFPKPINAYPGSQKTESGS